MSLGDRPLQPIVLTEDEAEAILSALREYEEAEHCGYSAAFMQRLYDKIKDAPK